MSGGAKTVQMFGWGAGVSCLVTNYWWCLGCSIWVICHLSVVIVHTLCGCQVSLQC